MNHIRKRLRKIKGKYIKAERAKKYKTGLENIKKG